MGKDNLLKTDLIENRCILSLELFVGDFYAERHPKTPCSPAVLDPVFASDSNTEGNVVPLSLPAPVLSLAFLLSLF